MDTEKVQSTELVEKNDNVGPSSTKKILSTQSSFSFSIKPVAMAFDFIHFLVLSAFLVLPSFLYIYVFSAVFEGLVSK